MRTLLLAALAAASLLAGCTDSSTPAVAPKARPAAATCAHGVQSDLCARCNPKLEPAFRAQNDWCAEHARPESQCVLCNPKLAEQGIQ